MTPDQGTVMTLPPTPSFGWRAPEPVTASPPDGHGPCPPRGVHVWVAAIEPDTVAVDVISGPSLIRLQLARGLFPEDLGAAETYWLAISARVGGPVMTVTRSPAPVSPAAAAIHARLAALRDSF